MASLVSKKNDRIHVFVIGAVADDIDLCLASMECDLEGTWLDVDEVNGGEDEDKDDDDDEDEDEDEYENDDEENDDEEGWEEGWEYGEGCSFDPRQLPFRLSSLIPHPYLWALNRAWATSDKHTRTLQDYFKKHLQTAKACA